MNCTPSGVATRLAWPGVRFTNPPPPAAAATLLTPGSGGRVCPAGREVSVLVHSAWTRGSGFRVHLEDLDAFNLRRVTWIGGDHPRHMLSLLL